jgi:hypothetical protein
MRGEVGLEGTEAGVAVSCSLQQFRNLPQTVFPWLPALRLLLDFLLDGEVAVDACDAVSGLSDEWPGLLETFVGEDVEGLLAELVAELRGDGGTWWASSCSQKGEVFTARMLIVIIM